MEITYMESRTFVLIAGAWHGAWVWRDVIPKLRAQQHTVTALTLTGVGERKHNASNATALSTHIEDVVAHIFMEGLNNVTLVGWSYGAFVAAGAAARIAPKVRSIIYIDSFIPQPGKAVIDYVTEESRRGLNTLAAEDRPIPAMPFDVFGVTESSVIDFVAPRLTLQPWKTFFEPLSTMSEFGHIPSSYIHCARAKVGTIPKTYESIRQA